MINLSQEQIDAIQACSDLSNRIVCVTGQAGTGKTTILQYVYENLIQDFPANFAGEDQVQLAAPTGRAAKRIQEATGIPAMTTHRMLKYTTPREEDDITHPRHTKLNPMPYDVVLIDEASMLSEEIYRGVIDSLKKGALVRFFGDINQLPPIFKDGVPFSPFADAMKKFPTFVLTHNYRSDDGIISVSDKVIKGRIPIANNQVSIPRIKVTDTMVCINDIAKKIDFTSMNNQIIVPTQKTKYGCDAINRFIQQRYNKEVDKINTYQRDQEGSVITRSFKRGDKIIWTNNDYNLEIMNGTLGIVQSFDKEEGTILCTFDGQDDIMIPPQIETFNPTTGERYRYDPRTQLMLGYAITTHRSQGSQFDTVLYTISRSRAATRQNLYTAVTRAKKKLIILNIAGALMHALNNRTAI